MAKGERRVLPLAPKNEQPTPVDVARKKLGGRGTSGPGQGKVVTVPAGGGRAVGVILFASDDEVLVLVDPSAVRKARPHMVVPFGGDVPEDIARLASDVGVFARLSEGDPIRYEASAGTMRDGTLVEKCRYGGLVREGGGAVVAVGFRKLWPAPAKGEAPS